MDTETAHMIHGPGHLGSWGMLRRNRDEQINIETKPADATGTFPASFPGSHAWVHSQPRSKALMRGYIPSLVPRLSCVGTFPALPLLLLLLHDDIISNKNDIIMHALSTSHDDWSELTQAFTHLYIIVEE